VVVGVQSGGSGAVCVLLLCPIEWPITCPLDVVERLIDDHQMPDPVVEVV
jgi:hypothetical protein